MICVIYLYDNFISYDTTTHIDLTTNDKTVLIECDVLLLP